MKNALAGQVLFALLEEDEADEADPVDEVALADEADEVELVDAAAGAAGRAVPKQATPPSLYVLAVVPRGHEAKQVFP